MKNLKYLCLIFTVFTLISCQKNQETEKNTTEANETAPIINKNTPKESKDIANSIPTGQLSKDIVPKHITLNLTIIPDDEYFNGDTTISATINSAQNHYYIHGNLLTVESVELKTASGELIEGEYKQVDESGIAKISFPKTIETGDVELSIAYKAKFNEALEGLYRVKDDDLNYAFTQFEAISARLAFPGFDEPAFKVPFDMSLTVKENHVAIANTPVRKTTQLPNGMKRLDYMTSKPLPAYLIAFAVGEFDVVTWEDLPVTNVRNRTVPLTGIATKGKGAKLKYALENTQAILESLENYFQIPYPYLKLDILAVPDFAAGAMENAGAITYREQLLLLDENSSQESKRRYMMVHAHELAHQWFGNLVTPYWWNDIWLNEAFATWMSYTALNPIFPEQNFNQSILQGSLGAMESDSLVSSRQIRQPIHSNHDISSAFDGITYRKGGGVLEMMNTFLTPEQFRNGIQNYMKKYAFKNANADEFIAAISEASQNIPAEVIKTAFNSFLEQPGIPYLTIKTSCEDGINKLAINQTRYLPLGSKGVSDNQTWKIPTCMNYEIDGNDHRDCHLIDAKEQNINLSGTGCAAFIMPNTNGSGYYRYFLDSEDWSKLYNNLENLTTNEIISLNDSFSASVQTGKINFTTLMKFAPIITNSELSNIASSPMSMISNMKEKVAESEDEIYILAKVANELYQTHYQRLSFDAKDNDSVEDTKLRNSVIGFIADTGNNKAVREKLIEMAKIYTGYKTDGELHEDLVNTNMLTMALRVTVEDLGQEFTDHLVELLDKAKDGTVRGRLLSGISSTKNTAFVEELRGWILSDRLRANEIFTILFSQIRDKDKREGMWVWMKTNFEAFKQRVPTGFHGRMPVIGSGFCSEEQKKELTDFFNPIMEEQSIDPRILAQVTEGINLCIVKKAHDKVMLKEYLASLK